MPAQAAAAGPQRALAKLGLTRDIDLALHLPLRYEDETYDELRKRGEVVFRIGKEEPFSFDYSFNYYPLAYERPGPEIVIYRLTGADCGDGASVSS